MSLIYDALKRLESSPEGVVSMRRYAAIPVHSATEPKRGWHALGYVTLLLFVAVVMMWQEWPWQVQSDPVLIPVRSVLSPVPSSSIIPSSVAATALSVLEHHDAMTMVSATVQAQDKGNLKIKSVSTEGMHLLHPTHAHVANIASTKNIDQNIDRQAQFTQIRPEPKENISRTPVVYKVKRLPVIRSDNEKYHTTVSAIAGVDKERVLVQTVHVTPSLPKLVKQDTPKVDSIAQQSVQNIVAELRLAMIQGNQTVVDAVLKRLDERAGVYSLIALRMHAYSAFKQHQYGSSRNYYNQVLALRPNDIEAGSNMALLEWRLGEAMAARKRIRLLRNIHPDSPILRRYMITMDADQ